MNYLQQKIQSQRAHFLKKMGQYPYFKAIEHFQDTSNIIIDGRKILMFGSNSYLGLEKHPKVIEATIKAIKKYGSSTGGSRFLNGTLKIHEELEAELASFLGKEAVVTFGTGFNVNSSVIPSITSRRDSIFTDRLNHASIYEGCALSLAKVYKYKHNDHVDLKRKIMQSQSEGERLIVSDGIFSMEGDIVDLPVLTKLAADYDCHIMLDCAHAVGVIGENGAGTASHFGLTDSVDLIGGTFSKSLASQGGFIAGNSIAIEYLKHAARSIMFSVSMSPANVAAALAALRIIKSDDTFQQQLQSNSLYLRQLLQEMGVSGLDTKLITPIIPLKVGNSEQVFTLTKSLFKDGFFVNPVVAPAVPENQAMLRLSVTAGHSNSQIEMLVDTLEKNWKQLARDNCAN
ncbi:MAG: pyridoxal phosphate-dependent aminotransferase family protein [Saprospiraceae bacterium]|nr:pyridoxal phosphate-dependent aminotransferase family protein [Saprospiraceae bacterium]